MANDLVSAAAIEEAARRLPEVVVRTPLLPARWLNEAVNGTVRLKCENFQLAGAFKIRGAYRMVSQIRSTIRRRGVITYSSGNHGQATALAARFFDIPAVVVMPKTAPAIKVEGARRLGAEVVLHGTTSTERKQKAEQIASERKLNMVPPFDHPDIIAGQGTVGREIMQDWPDVEAVLVPVGGGGLISGLAAWIKSANPDCKVIGVEPRSSDAMRRSLAAGEPVTIEPGDSIADGLLPVRPGDLTFAHAKELVDEVVVVDDDAIIDATSQLLNRSKMVAEFSGAAAVAALLSGAWRPEGKRVVAVVSGGNLDPERAMELLRSDSSAAAREKVAAKLAETAETAKKVARDSTEEKAAASPSTKKSAARSPKKSAARSPKKSAARSPKKSAAKSSKKSAAKSSKKSAAKSSKSDAKSSKKSPRKSSKRKVSGKSSGKKVSGKSPKKKSSGKSPKKKARK